MGLLKTQLIDEGTQVDGLTQDLNSFKSNELVLGLVLLFQVLMRQDSKV